MKKVTKYICEICLSEYANSLFADTCEFQCREFKEKRETELAEIKKWREKGEDTWYENGNIHHAPKVDPDKFGAHKYASDWRTSDCEYGCGCWMGECRSGGKINPFGACPNNPKEKV